MQRLISAIVTLIVLGFSIIGAEIPADGFFIPDDSTVYGVKSPCAMVELTYSDVYKKSVNRLYFDSENRKLMLISANDYFRGSMRIDTLLFAKEGFINRIARAKANGDASEVSIYDKGVSMVNGPMDGIGRSFDLWVADYDKQGNWQTAYKNGEPNSGSVLAKRCISYSLSSEEKAMVEHYSAMRDSLKFIDSGEFRQIAGNLADMGLASLQPFFTQKYFLATGLILFVIVCFLFWVALSMIPGVMLRVAVVFIVALPLLCLGAGILGFGIYAKFGAWVNLLFLTAFAAALCTIIPKEFKQLVYNPKVTNTTIGFFHLCVTLILVFGGYMAGVSMGGFWWGLLIAVIWGSPALLAFNRGMNNRCPSCHTPGTYRLVEQIDAGTHTETWSDTPHTHTDPWKTKEVVSQHSGGYHERSEATTTKTTTHHTKVCRMIRERYYCSHCGYEWISERKRADVISHDKSSTTEKTRTERRIDIS